MNTAGVRGVRFRQMDCSRTDYPAGSFDLVTSTMLLHELPPAVVEKTLAEAHRLLRPGVTPVKREAHGGPLKIAFSEPVPDTVDNASLPGLAVRFGVGSPVRGHCASPIVANSRFK